MREKSDITHLFRTRLEQAGMDVRDGFWETLEHDLHTLSETGITDERPRKKRFDFPVRRWVAAASVFLLLGAALWMWEPSVPEEKMEPGLSSIPSSAGRSELSVQDEEERMLADGAFRPSPCPEMAAPGNGALHLAGHRAGGASASADEEPVSVHVSITITQRQYGTRQSGGQGHYHAAGGHNSHKTHGGWSENDGMAQESCHTASVEECGALLKSRDWAWKASLGTSLPEGDYRAPLTAGLSVEHRLTKHLSLEAGVQYNRLAEAGKDILHVVGIPVKLNILLAQSRKLDFYAQVGGMVEKCVAGAADNSFEAEPVQGAVLAGLGVSYKMNDRLALFAEPSVSHYFASEASTRTLRTERLVNVNLLCGLRMTY